MARRPDETATAAELEDELELDEVVVGELLEGVFVEPSFVTDLEVELLVVVVEEVPGLIPLTWTDSDVVDVSGNSVDLVVVGVVVVLRGAVELISVIVVDVVSGGGTCTVVVPPVLSPPSSQ